MVITFSLLKNLINFVTTQLFSGCSKETDSVLEMNETGNSTSIATQVCCAHNHHSYVVGMKQLSVHRNIEELV